MTRKHSLVAAALGCLTLLAGAAALADNSAPVSDSQITDRVVGKLAVDDPDVAKHLSVETKDGVVTISGHAFSGSQAGKVLRDAQSVSGVVKVQNHISLTQ